MKVIPVILSATVILSLTFCSTQKNISTTKATDLDLSTVTYLSHVKKIIDNNCVECHGGYDPADGLDLTTYNKVKHAAEDHHLLDLIHSTSKPMPPEGLLPENERAIITSWAKNGYKKGGE